MWYISRGFNGTYCVLEDKTYKILNVSQDINELIIFLKSEKIKREQEIKLLQEYIRFFDAQR